MFYIVLILYRGPFGHRGISGLEALDFLIDRSDCAGIWLRHALRHLVAALILLFARFSIVFFRILSINNNIFGTLFHFRSASVAEPLGAFGPVT